MRSTSIVFRVFIRYGRGKNARDSGQFSTVAEGYVAAARKFAAHWNECSFGEKFGTRWRHACTNMSGMPARARAYYDEKGNKLILIPE